MTELNENQAGAPALAPVSRPFLGLFALAHLGAFIAFIPMLNLLLPLKAELIDPAGKAVLLSQVMLWGAVAAAVTNLAAGAFSDATRGPFGRRRPWIVVGALAVAGAHGLVFAASTPQQLLAAVLVFQAAVNVMFGPLNAVLPDIVPGRQKGLAAALAGLALPGAGLFTAAVLAVALARLDLRFLVVALAVPLLVLPFALRLREPQRPRPHARVGLPSLSALADRDFLMAFASRLLVQVTITFNVLYLLFYLQETARLGPLAHLRPEAVLGGLLGLSTAVSLAAGFLGGILSDRLRRRRPFVTAGGLAMAGGAALLAAAPVWPGPLAAQLLFGVGLGLYSTVDTALVAEVLPDRRAAGRDLGLMNLAITAPQVLAPLLGLGLLSLSGGDFRWVYAVSALFALFGGLAVAGIRRVR